MISWIIAWYVIGFVSAVLNDRLFEYWLYWDIGARVDPFTYRDLVKCLFFGVGGLIPAFMLAVLTVMVACTLSWHAFNRRVNLDTPVFGEKKKKK